MNSRGTYFDVRHDGGGRKQDKGGSKEEGGVGGIHSRARPTLVPHSRPQHPTNSGYPVSVTFTSRRAFLVR